MPLRRTRYVHTLLSFVLAAAVTACSSDDVNPTDPGGNTPTPDFTIALSSATLAVNQGASGSVTVNLTRTGGFTGAVAVTVQGLPANVTSAGLSIPAGATSGTLAVSAAAAAAAGATNLTVRATGAGVSEKTAALALTVNAVAVPTFSISLAPTAISLEAGGPAQVDGPMLAPGTGQTTVTITRGGGFTGAVTLAASGLPTGVTATFAPAAPTGNTSTLTLVAAANATVGTATVTVQGSATGLANQTAQVALTVTAAPPPPPPPPSGSISWDFCESEDDALPIWVAAKDGDGAWTRAGGTSSRATLPIGGSVGGVAWVTPDGGSGWNLEVFYGTRAEIVAVGAERCDGLPGVGKTITANVTGVGPSDFPSLTLGGVPAFAPPGGTSFRFEGVPNGPVDLVGGRASIDQTAFSIVPNRLLIRRGLNPADGSTIQVDFDGPDGFAPEVRSLAITNVGSDAVAAFTMLNTANGFGAVTAGFAGASGPNSWYGVPAARLQPGDLHLVVARAAPDDEDEDRSRTTLRMVANPVDLTIPLGPELTQPTVQSLGGTGYARARAVYPIQSAYARLWFADFQQSGQDRYTTVQMTREFRGSSSGTVTLEVPDFSGVSDWNPTWGLQFGNLVEWTFTAMGWSQPGGIVIPPWADGTTYDLASRMGQFTP